MIRGIDPWQLPSAASFLDEVEVALEGGLVAIASDPTVLPGIENAILAPLASRHWVVERVTPGETDAPATVLSAPFGAVQSLDGLLTSGLFEHVAVLDLSRVAVTKRDAWRTFLQRFYERRQALPGGLSILVQGLSIDWAAAADLPVLFLGDRLRRLDVTIWADLHAPSDRPEPLATLATALAVELCAWRLDLAAAIAQASTEDLLEPLGWLARRDEVPQPVQRHFGGLKLGCPLSLFARNSRKELESRIWRAQLAAFFPWIEEQRLEIIRRHRGKLRIDEHLRQLGVRDAEDIELGALARQLDGRIAASEAAFSHCLARIRNRLAHRRPAAAPDLSEVIRRSK